MVEEARVTGGASKATSAAGRQAWFWGLVAAGVALDQITKLVVHLSLELHDRVAVIPGLFYLTYVLNPGMAFSLGRRLGQAAPFVLVALNVVIIGIVIHLRAKARVPSMRRPFDLAMGLILAGAFGNVIDRVHPPFKVLDFLDFWLGTPGPKKWHYPTFNVADIYIVVGVGIYMFWAWRSEKKAKPGTGGARSGA